MPFSLSSPLRRRHHQRICRLVIFVVFVLVVVLFVVVVVVVVAAAPLRMRLHPRLGEPPAALARRRDLQEDAAVLHPMVAGTNGRGGCCSRRRLLTKGISKGSLIFLEEGAI
jgi:hypothetical protein